jgi:hypothetical protein
MLIAAVWSVKLGRIAASTSLQNKESWMELDTHADTTVLGKSCLVIQDFNKTVSVSGWNASVGSTECPTVSGVVAYDHPYTGITYMLVWHQAIYLETMENHLICPMQCRVNGVVVNDTPKIFVKDPTNKSHAIVVLDPIDPGNELIIPLELNGVTSRFSVRTPSLQEFENDDNPRIDMTGEAPDWDPHNSDWSQQEASMTDLRGNIQGFDYDVVARGRRLINSVSCSYLQVNPTDCEDFADALGRNVRVCRAKTSRGWRAIDVDALAEKWMVSQDIARRTLSRTTRRGIRTNAHSSMSRRFRTNDRHLRYRRLRHNMYRLVWATDL